MSAVGLTRLGGVVVVALIALVACSQKERTAAPDANVAPPPPPPPAVVDAGPDVAVTDAGADADDARGVPAAARKAAPAAGGGGMAGLAVSGSLPKAAVAKVLRGGAGALRACYEKGHARNPDLRGRVNFKLTVDARGRVTLGEVATSTLHSADTEMCMAQATRGFKFPPPPDGAESTVTFVLSFGR